MKVKTINVLNLFISFLALIATGISCYFVELKFTVFFSLITFVYSFKIIKNAIIKLNSFSIFFLLFYFLYTYSPILTVIFDIDNRRLFIDSTPESACLYIFISTLGLFGLSIPYLIKIKEVIIPIETQLNKKQQFTFLALFFVILSLMGELSNIFRAGGFELLKYGKAVYQAKTADIFITFPSALFLQIGYFFLGLRMYLSYNNNYLKSLKNKIFILTTLIAVPLLFIYISVGFRSPLLGVFIAYAMGYSYFITLKTIKKKALLFIFIGYSLMAILYGIRGQLRLLFTSGDWDRFNYYVFQEKTFLYYYNPANNEFGAPYTNYIKFYNDNDNTLLYGESYLSGFLIPIPRALLPFKKPLPISYKFRDKYFNSWKKSSRIAGSGFSYVMETQWNFGIIGPFIVYFFTGCLFWLLEYFRNKNKFLLFFPLFYAVFLPLTQSIHRSSFGFLISNIIVLTISILLIVVLRKWLPKKK